MIPPEDITAEPSSPPPEEDGEEPHEETVAVLKDFKSTIKIFDGRLKELERKESETKERLDRAESKIEESKISSIESLGLFVALFTFISVEFSLFREIKSYSAAVALTLIVAGLLLAFVLVLHFILRGKSLQWFFVFLILLILSGSLIWFGINFPDYYIKKDFFIDPTLFTIPSWLPKN